MKRQSRLKIMLNKPGLRPVVPEDPAPQACHELAALGLTPFRSEWRGLVPTVGAAKRLGLDRAANGADQMQTIRENDEDQGKI